MVISLPKTLRILSSHFIISSLVYVLDREYIGYRCDDDLNDFVMDPPTLCVGELGSKN